MFYLVVCYYYLKDIYVCWLNIRIDLVGVRLYEVVGWDGCGELRLCWVLNVGVDVGLSECKVF